MDPLQSVYFFKCCYSRTFEKNMNTLFTLQNDLSLLLFEIKTSTSCDSFQNQFSQFAVFHTLQS